MSKSVFHSLLLSIHSVKVKKEIDKGSGSGNTGYGAQLLRSYRFRRELASFLLP